MLLFPFRLRSRSFFIHSPLRPSHVLLRPGRPFALQNCSMERGSPDSVQVDCIESFDGGLPQGFLLELVEVPSLRLVRNMSLLVRIPSTVHSTIFTFACVYCFLSRKLLPHLPFLPPTLLRSLIIIFRLDSHSTRPSPSPWSNWNWRRSTGSSCLPSIRKGAQNPSLSTASTSRASRNSPPTNWICNYPRLSQGSLSRQLCSSSAPAVSSSPCIAVTPGSKAQCNQLPQNLRSNFHISTPPPRP